MFIPHYFSRQNDLSKRPRANSKSTRLFTAQRRMNFEHLEDRRVLALVGVAPLDLPIIGYDSGGTVSYDNVSNQFSLTATPLSIESPTIGLFDFGTLSIQLVTDEFGGLAGGVPGDDLVLTGQVDIDGDFNPDFSGVLLTGEISAFGFEDSGGSTDLYDFRFTITGGALASLYSGSDLGVTTTSESSTFTGDFGVDFVGNAKGNLGGIEVLTPGIDIEKLTNGVDVSSPADAVEINPGETVTFTYAVTNTGQIPFAFSDVDVTDDNGTPGDASDDVSTTGGQIIFDPSSDVGGDLILSPGESWLYNYATTAEDLYLDDCGCEVGIYHNTSVVTVPGATDADDSFYTNPSDAPPCIAYDSGGSVSYDAATDEFSLSATPLSTEDGGLFDSGTLSINIVVDGAGMLVGGVPGDDFILVGDLDANGDFVVDYSGTLLTGEIISFLGTDSGGSTDTYEFRFSVTGGLLAAQYVGMDLRVTTTSESSTFTGDFSTDFGGNAKGEVCCVCIETANLSGKKYTDQTGNGVSGDDTPLSDITVNLYQDNGVIGVLDGPDVFYASDVTDVNGEYSFTNVPAGNYLVQEIVPVGYQATTPTILAVTLAPHDNITTGFDFANFQLGSLSGKKFQDLDGDGTDDGGSDPGLAGWTIELDKDADGTVDDTTVTGAGGVYSFTGLTAGVYRVREVGQAGWIQTTVNPGDVSVVSGTNSTENDFGNRQRVPGIDLEKTTNGPTNSNPVAPDYDNEDSENGPGVPMLIPGSTVTWTYKVTNTGELDYTFSEVVIVDDGGTPGSAGDDLSTTNGQITFQSVQIGDADNILEPGEVWLYTASGIVQNVGSSGSAVTFDFSGSSALDGPDGNIRTFSAGGVSVKASAFSRDSSSVWQTAYLGSYGGGLGVTDQSEGSGSNNTHTVDNTGRDNYVLFEFSESVVVDSAFLGYVVNDSDLRIWIGTLTDPYSNHQTLSDALLSGMFTEVNETTLTTTRLADLNAGEVSGNVIIIAANTGEPTTEDNFKIEKLTVSPHGCYENRAVVTVPGATDSDLSHYCNSDIPPDPNIDIEKFTNGVDADTAAEAPEIAPGDTVTWTYKVTNTGNIAFTSSEVVVRDDNGTASNTSDDFSPTFDAALSAGLHDGDSLLEPGEMWIYKATGVAQDLVATGSTTGTFNFSGSSSTDGTDGNIRTFTAGGVSVKTSAFSRDKSSGAWSSAYLGSYSGGLGVTDSSEGSGGNNMHTVDNSGRDNYVLFEFSESVVVDSAFLGYVVYDSDLTVWIGSSTDPFNNHLTLSDSLLSGLGFTEVNTGGSSTRTADINAGELTGNVLVIAAKKGESNDRFKIEKLNFKKTEPGIYKNVGKVTAGGVSDTDVSHYKNPESVVVDPECVDVSFVFSGNTSTTGTKGNVRTYTSSGVSVNVSAFSRTTSGAWSSAYLGAYSEGLGVTDRSESGSGGTHRVDNVGELNFVLFEFSTLVEIDRAFLDSVVTDSDVSIWVGTASNPFQNHLTLSDSLAGIMSYSETNNGGGSDRWAEFGSGNTFGNVLVIAASVEDDTPDDQFKISKLDVCAQTVKFYTVDPSADQTFEYGAAGQALSNYGLATSYYNTNARGVASTEAGNKVWVIDGNKKVYVYDTNGGLLGSWKAYGLTTPEDITTDGFDLWIVDDGSNKVFKYSGGSGSGANRTSYSQSASSSFSLNSANENAKGIVTDGTHLWVVNDAPTGSDEVFKYTLSGSLVGSWTIDSNNGSPTGITIDPANVNHIWIVDSADDAVYRYNSATGRTTGSQAADQVFHLAGGNGNAQGIADPPPVGISSILSLANNGSASAAFLRTVNFVNHRMFGAGSRIPAAINRLNLFGNSMFAESTSKSVEEPHSNLANGNSHLPSLEPASAARTHRSHSDDVSDIELDVIFDGLGEGLLTIS